jgi:pimeloyl-ACP methyl ester carboxylesterase
MVLCHPMGEEYIRFHRALRRLSDRLAAVGFPVLRFDLYGCGDSSGESEQGRIDRWCADVAMAADEMRQRARVREICLVGLRLGGSLSMIAGAEQGDVDGMVLWDPVVSGRDYLEELGTLHRRMLLCAHVKPRRDRPGKASQEILGFPLTDSMRSDLEFLDLLNVQQRPANNMLLIESNPRTGIQQLGDHLRNRNVDPAVKHFPDPRLWVWEEAVGRVLVPSRILQSLVSWACEVYP